MICDLEMSGIEILKAAKEKHRIRPLLITTIEEAPVPGIRISQVLEKRLLSMAIFGT